jgi:hypothetical protein
MTGLSLSTDGDVSGNHGNGDMWVVKLKDASIATNPFLGPANFFDIYPNPSQDIVHLRIWGDQLVKHVEFYDLLGRKLLPPYDLNGNTVAVHITNVPVGTYLARLFFSYEDYYGVFTRPLIIQR